MCVCACLATAGYKGSLWCQPENGLLRQTGFYGVMLHFLNHTIKDRLREENKVREREREREKEKERESSLHSAGGGGGGEGESFFLRGGFLLGCLERRSPG